MYSLKEYNNSKFRIKQYAINATVPDMSKETFNFEAIIIHNQFEHKNCR